MRGSRNGARANVMSLFDKYDQVNARHDRLVAAGRDPFNICMDRIVSATAAIVDGHEVILVGTNNYLGLTFDPDCIESTVAAIRRAGTGTRSEERRVGKGCARTCRSRGP